MRPFAVKNSASPRRRADLSSGEVTFMGEAALVEGVRARQPAAVAALYDAYAAHVLRVLGRVLGAERELSDLHQEVFLKAIDSMDRLEDPRALKAWMTGIAVHTARAAIQRRVRRRWLTFLAPEDLPEPEAPSTGDAGEALRATYAVLDQLPADERIAFVLRVIDGMELTEVAAACGVSLATIKRRLARAEERFTTLARDHDVLHEWLEGGSRWGTPDDR
ncbi:MAG: sigma-70 family RNA polymerase sigma factor [Minicystis sp.]